MKNSRIQAKAQVIDARAKKDKILYASAALLIGLLAAVVFSTNVRAEQVVKSNVHKEWTPHIQIEGETVLPFELKSQKFSH